MVYQAWYEDTLMPEKMHTVLIKELYPYDSLNRIQRNENMSLEVLDGAEELFENHRKVFFLAIGFT